GVQGIVLRGIDPQKEVRVTELAKNIKSGRLAYLEHPEQAPRPDRREEDDTPTAKPQAEPANESPAKVHPGIILGKELAMRLGVFPGDTVNVVSPVGSISAISIIPKIRIFTV